MKHLKETFRIISSSRIFLFHIGMARPRVTDRGGSFQVWRVAMNVLSKRTGD